MRGYPLQVRTADWVLRRISSSGIYFQYNSGQMSIIEGAVEWKSTKPTNAP